MQRLMSEIRHRDQSLCTMLFLQQYINTYHGCLVLVLVPKIVEHLPFEHPFYPGEADLRVDVRVAPYLILLQDNILYFDPCPGLSFCADAKNPPLSIFDPICSGLA